MQNQEIKTRRLERFAKLIDREDFEKARTLAENVLATRDDFAQSQINYAGYEVVSRYLHVNKEKARRICEAFQEYSWTNWLK